jgi:ribosome-associated heat shock protein Hsp15
MRRSSEAVPVELWLWAARIVKTREAAAAAVSGGQLLLDGAPAAAGALVRPGARLELTEDESVLRLLVKATSRLRGPDSVAAGLYQPLDEDGRPLGRGGPVGASKAARRAAEDAANSRRVAPRGGGGRGR